MGECHMKIAVMTDSTAYIPKEMRQEYGIHMVPLSVVFGEKAYREEIEISVDEFYQKVKESEALPTTSQPSVGDVVKKLEELVDEGYSAVVSIHLSSKLSGTYHAVASAGDMVDGIKVYAFDSGYSCMPQGFMALKAVELAKQGQSPEEIIQKLERIKASIRAYFIVDDLSHLQRGGRLTSAQALVGSLLKVKPILHIVEGKIVPFEKIRTRKKAINRVMDMLYEDAENKEIEKVVFIHGNQEEAAIQLRDEFSKKYPLIETVISYFGPVIGTHLGEGSLGVSWYTK